MNDLKWGIHISLPWPVPINGEYDLHQFAEKSDFLIMLYVILGNLCLSILNWDILCGA